MPNKTSSLMSHEPCMHVHKHSCALRQIRCATTQVWHEVQAVQRFRPEAMGLFWVGPRLLSGFDPLAALHTRRTDIRYVQQINRSSGGWHARWHQILVLENAMRRCMPHIPQLIQVNPAPCTVLSHLPLSVSQHCPGIRLSPTAPL